MSLPPCLISQGSSGNRESKVLQLGGTGQGPGHCSKGRASEQDVSFVFWSWSGQIIEAIRSVLEEEGLRKPQTFFSSFSSAGTEPRALLMLGKHFATELHPQCQGQVSSFSICRAWGWLGFGPARGHTLQ